MSSQNAFVDLKNKVDPFDSVKIILLAIFTNLFAEFLTWMFIYRTKRYTQTKKEIDLLNKKIEMIKESKEKAKHGEYDYSPEQLEQMNKDKDGNN